MNGILIWAASCVLGQVGSLECDHPLVDLGKCRGGPSISHRFVLWNRGTAEVRIVHVQPSCGCVVPRLTGRVVKAGDSVEVAVHVGTISQPEGANLWSVRLYYRSAGSDEDCLVNLQMRADLHREVAVQPAALRLSGKPGLTHPLQCIDRRPQPMELRAVASSSGRLEVWDEGQWHRRNHEWVRTLHVRMSANCPPGRYDDFVQIVARDPDYHDVRIPVTLNRTDQQRFVATPSEIRFSHEKPEFSVILRDTEGAAVQVEDVQCDDPAIQVRYSTDRQPSVILHAKWTPGMNSPYWSAVRIQIAAPIRQTVVIPVTILTGATENRLPKGP
jgi:hypothetical protein